MLSSAAGVLSLLSDEQDLQSYALQKLNEIVDVFWAEISDQVSKIEVLYENKAFKQRQLAALVCSKVYFHLGEFKESLSFALGAGPLFNLDAKSDIDRYIELRTLQYDDPTVVIDPALTEIVQRMFQRCYQGKEFRQVIGIALESYRLDILEEAIVKGDAQTLLAHVLQANMTVVHNLSFRNKVLKVLVKLYQNLPVPDSISSSQCFVHLNEPQQAAEILVKLTKGTPNDQLVAYQIAFDLEDNATQDFSTKVKSFLPPISTPALDSTAMDTDASPVTLSNQVIVQGPLDKIHHILSGETAIKLYLEFLYRNNHTDLLILKTTKNCFDSRNSAHHSAITFANAFQNAGTTSDAFLRQNLEWLSRATNWSKFSATAALGVIHKGHLSQSSALLAPYLPKEGVSGSAFSEGGALFALGLIHANHGASVIPKLTLHLKDSVSEVLQHGAALGLGVAGMSSGDEEIYENLKNVLYNDNAVAGEAAGLSMGLVMLGTGSEKCLEEMLQYARDTQHEKIIRGLAVGMSLIQFGREEGADAQIETLLAAKDPILRYGGIYTVSMAYSGTGNNKAIKKLLHFAVSDVSDEVRRAAVTGLGFILFKTPEHVPRIVQLLSESYNPHVRYGATLALGISCGGTGMSEALKLLQPMTKDSVDYVRQGALIALGMILVQHNEASCPEVASTRKLYETVIADKREELLCRLGAVIGQGIIDAGGRNVTLSLTSRSGYANIPAIVGMALFTQFWYWFPLSHFLSLCFTPTGVMGLNKDLEVPKFEFVSKSKPSLYAYPPELVAPTTEVIEKVKTAVLSTTVKAIARAKQQKGQDMELDETPVKETVASSPVVEEKKKEPEQETLLNFARVVPGQIPCIDFSGSRYKPVKAGVVSGILMLHDSLPATPEELIELSIPLSGKTPAIEVSAPAVVAPQPFEYTETE